MTLPTALNAAIQTAEAAMLADETGHIHSGYRNLIWRGFDDRPNSKLRSRCITYVSYLCATKVLPNWFAFFPHDPYPRQVFELLTQHLIHKKEVPDLLKHMSTVYGLGEDIFHTHRIQIYYGQEEYYSHGQSYNPTLLTKATEVCYTLSSCIRDVLYGDETYSEVPVSTNEVGRILEDCDPYDFDTSMLASMSYTGAAYWQKEHREDRIEFWQWWLHEAVPQAWGMVSD